jgi:hypothetical protein
MGPTDYSQYSIYVLESSTSGRLTYFMPPLNLIPLVFLRPLRLILPRQDARAVRIVVLKATHAPFVAIIWTYERLVHLWISATSALASRGPQSSTYSPPDRTDSNGMQGVAKLRRHRPGRAVAPHQPNGLSNHRISSTNMENTELIALIQGLSAKVDDLVAMVAGQQAT